MEIKVKVPGSCGELVQGFFHSEPFLITCPVELFTTVIVSDQFNERIGLGWKAIKMLELTLHHLHCDNFNFGIKLSSELLHGKGMASSSSDIAAIAKAVALSLSVDITANEIAKLATKIEPTDGIFFDGIISMNPVTGEIINKFESIPEFKIAVFDFGGKVDTLNFKRRNHFTLSKLPISFVPEMIIESALANQKVLYKPDLEQIVEFAMSIGAISVNAAHSGTVIGVFWDDELSEVNKKAELIAKKFPQIKFMTITNLIHGGFY